MLFGSYAPTFSKLKAALRATKFMMAKPPHVIATECVSFIQCTKLSMLLQGFAGRFYAEHSMGSFCKFWLEHVSFSSLCIAGSVGWLHVPNTWPHDLACA